MAFEFPGLLRCARNDKDMTMIDLYALTSPNVQKIYLMLEETKLPYKEHFVDVWKGEQHSPDFIKVNPNAKIPAIVDHDGPAGPTPCSSPAPF
jgi:glutathione S-transferase